MDALILSCGTGGGHDSAALAIKEALEQLGDHAVMMNPYQLHSDKMAQSINHIYIRTVQKCPSLFGAVYGIGEAYRKLPVRSPVYHINRTMVARMEQYLKQHHYDVIISTHLFPAEIMTQMRNRHMPLPKTIFISTDYTCIPFTEETSCDAYVLPTEKHIKEYVALNFKPDTLYPLGIPVRPAFLSDLTQMEARERLGLDVNKRYILLCGGSMGAGHLMDFTRQLYDRKSSDTGLIVICGNNESLYSALKEAFEDRILLLKSTSDMALYMRACNVYLTKPGGLSSTEAAVMGIPLIHLPPIPGCETINADFFARNGMSIRLDGDTFNADKVFALMDNADAQRCMIRNQKTLIPEKAAEHICALAHLLVENETYK